MITAVSSPVWEKLTAVIEERHSYFAVFRSLSILNVNV